MSGEEDENETLASLYRRARSIVSLDGTLTTDASEASTVVKLLIRCGELVRQLSLFSSNEQIEDISTADLR
jgi:hypothetical protein